MDKLVKYDEMCRAIAEAHRIDEVKDLRDKAQALEVYARQARNFEAQNRAAEIRIRAERRAGELLTEADKHKGGRPKKNQSHDATGFPQTISSLGITRSQSSRWQMMAGIPEEQFENIMSQHIDEQRELVSKTFLKIARAVKGQASASIIQPKENETCTVKDLARLAETGRKFGCIYADPPWQYGNQGTRAATGNHYTGMSVDDIRRLPIAELTAEKSHCHLWTTNAFLPEAFSILEAWGFVYKSCFVWVKPQMGIGNYWRVSHEFLLLGVKGSLPFRAHDEKSWKSYDRRQHSAKPEQIIRTLMKVSPAPYLELFGRRIVPGWVVWGNQITRTLFDDGVAAL